MLGGLKMYAEETSGFIRLAPGGFIALLADFTFKFSWDLSNFFLKHRQIKIGRNKVHCHFLVDRKRDINFFIENG
jgi:hypothetical protein